MPVVKRETAGPPMSPAGTNPVDRIRPVGKSDKKDTMVVYGVSGTGKTTFACTYPKPLLIIGAEDGTRSVSDVQGVDFGRIYKPHEMRDMIEHVKSSRKYRTVVLDTATQLQSMVLADILGLEELPTQKSFGMADRSQWGRCALETKEWLRHLLRLAEQSLCHVIILAQDKTFKGGDDTVDSELITPCIMANLSPSTVTWLNPEVDYIVQTFIRQKENVTTTKVGDEEVTIREKTKGVEYCLRTAAHPIYVVKFRGPKGKKIPECIIDPDYHKVQKLIKGE